MYSYCSMLSVRVKPKREPEACKRIVSTMLRQCLGSWDSFQTRLGRLESHQLVESVAQAVVGDVLLEHF